MFHKNLLSTIILKSYLNIIIIKDRGTRSWEELREFFAGNKIITYIDKKRVYGNLILSEAVQVLLIKGKDSGK